MFSGLCIAMVWLPWSARAQAVPDDDVRGRLIGEGLQAASAGDHARAIALFNQAGRIEMRPGLRAALAQQHAALGHQREACDLATRAVDEARGDLARPENGRALQAGAAVASTACPQVGRVHLVFPMEAWRGAGVTVQGRALDPSGEEASVAVDPGEAPVQVLAPDGRSFRMDVTVRAGETAEVRVVLLRPAAIVRPEPVVTTPVVRPEPVVTTSDVPAPERPAREGPGAGPWILGGAGALSLALMGVFYGIETSALASCNVQGNLAYCLPSSVDTVRSNTSTWAMAGNVALGLGLAGIAGGVIWWVAGVKSEQEPVTVGLNPQGFTVGGRF